MRPRALAGAAGPRPQPNPPTLPTVAYAAYVENGMPMQLRRKRKTGCYRVLRENVAIPMIQNHQESPFCAIIDVPR